MIKLPPTTKEKEARERSLDEMEFVSSFDWRLMKKLSSETGVRQWHIKVDCGKTDNGRPIYEDFCVSQMWVNRRGEMLYGYRASRSGRPLDLCKFIFEKPGEDWVNGIEYLLRSLEGQDISKLRLDR